MGRDYHYQRRRISIGASDLEHKMEQKDLDDILNSEIDHLKLEESLFLMEFGPMRSYAKAVEKFLVDHAEKTSQKAPIPKRGMSEDEIYDSYAEHASDMDEIKRAFPKILRYSLFVYVHSFFERALLRLAENYRKDRKLALSPSDLKHGGIEKVRIYLKKVVHVPFPDEGSAWQDIKAFNVIRNQIAHNEGKLPNNSDDRKAVEAFAKKWHDDISIDYDEIEFNKAFIFRVLDTFHTFSVELFAGLRSSPSRQGVV